MRFFPHNLIFDIRSDSSHNSAEYRILKDRIPNSNPTFVVSLVNIYLYLSFGFLISDLTKRKCRRRKIET